MLKSRRSRSRHDQIEPKRQQFKSTGREAFWAWLNLVESLLEFLQWRNSMSTVTRCYLRCYKSVFRPPLPTLKYNSSSENSVAQHQAEQPILQGANPWELHRLIDIPLVLSSPDRYPLPASTSTSGAQGEHKAAQRHCFWNTRWHVWPALVMSIWNPALDHLQIILGWISSRK